ncbi:pumilio homolog 3-like [Phragmites australis]|uniref:pumilio homolog 3-like n=1 Tax=Phragmites australis TaxID=29695 RepID=UPI002D76CC75|nr:pumilio homolog 3-like [Phragmites australis]
MERCIVVMRFTRRVVQMSYHNFTCNVIEKCLTHGSYQDRQLVTNEILAAGGGHNFDHLVDMMLNPYANLVIQKMLVTADEWQVSVIEEVARRNLGKLMSCSHGKQVISTIQSVFTARGTCVPPS